MACTIYDIAKECNCSTTTVSKVLNNVGKISSEKRKEILETANALGYVRSQSAVSLASSNKSSHLIGVVLHIREDRSITHELFSEIINYLRIEVEKEGYDICFLRNLTNKDKLTYSQLVQSRGIDGIVILSLSTDTKKFLELMDVKTPKVSFDLFNTDYFVTSMNKEGVADMVDYLVSMGHTRICYVRPGSGGVAKKRLEGFIEGLSRNNIPYDPRMIIDAPYYSKGSAKEATDKALNSGINPTAIMYPDDYTAISAIPYLRKLGLKVPNDISITGFDGVEVSKVMRPSIVTVRQDTKEIGKSCAKLLLAQLSNREVENKRIIVPTKLLKGESVKKIN